MATVSEFTAYFESLICCTKPSHDLFSHLFIEIQMLNPVITGSQVVEILWGKKWLITKGKNEFSAKEIL